MDAPGRPRRSVPALTGNMRFVVLMLLMVASIGCSERQRKQFSLAPVGSLTDATTLRQSITGADQIIIENRFPEDSPRYRGFSLTISGSKVKTVIKAVSAAEPTAVGTRSLWDWDFRFYRKTRYIGSIYTAGSTFLLGEDPPNAVFNFLGAGVVGHEEYDESTGVLEKICDDLRRRTRR